MEYFTASDLKDAAWNRAVQENDSAWAIAAALFSLANMIAVQYRAPQEPDYARHLVQLIKMLDKQKTTKNKRRKRK